jgi:hypothetical protein
VNFPAGLGERTGSTGGDGEEEEEEP